VPVPAPTIGLNAASGGGGGGSGGGTGPLAVLGWALAGAAILSSACVLAWKAGVSRGQSNDDDQSTTPHAFPRKIETLEGPIWSKIKSGVEQHVSAREQAEQAEQADSAGGGATTATTATTGEGEARGGESSSTKRPFEEETSQ